MLIPFILIAEDTLTIAPLMPLQPGDPLELNLKLRERLYEQDESDHNLAVFKSYTIPWIKILPLLLLALFAPLLFYILKNMQKKQSGPSVYTLIQQIQALQGSPLSPKELAFEVAKLFKMGFENGPSMTYQELIDHIQDRYSDEDLKSLQLQFEQLEKIQYKKENPSYEQVQEARLNTEHFLQTQFIK